MKNGGKKKSVAFIILVSVNSDESSESYIKNYLGTSKLFYGNGQMVK